MQLSKNIFFLVALAGSLFLIAHCAPVEPESIDDILFRGKVATQVTQKPTAGPMSAAMKSRICKQICWKNPSQGGTFCNCDSVSTSITSFCLPHSLITFIFYFSTATNLLEPFEEACNFRKADVKRTRLKHRLKKSIYQVFFHCNYKMVLWWFIIGRLCVFLVPISLGLPSRFESRNSPRSKRAFGKRKSLCMWC